MGAEKEKKFFLVEGKSILRKMIAEHVKHTAAEVQLV